MRPVPDRSSIPSGARPAVARVAAGGTLLMLAATPLWGQAKRPMAWVDAQRLRSVAGTAISPDGNQMLYALTTPDWKEATTQSDLYLVRTDRGLESTRQLTFTKDKNESQPRWAPAGGWFVFSSNREGAAGDAKQQLFLMRADGGEARRITSAKDGVSTFAFSKDGQWLVYRSGKASEEQLYALAMLSLDRGTPLGGQFARCEQRLAESPHRQPHQEQAQKEQGQKDHKGAVEDARAGDLPLRDRQHHLQCTAHISGFPIGSR